MRKISYVVILAISILGIATNIFAQGVWAEDSSSAFVGVAEPGSCVLGGKIWIMGGAQSLNVVYFPDTVQIFDPDNHAWGAGTSMTFGRIGFTCSVLDGKIYAIGGITENGTLLDTMEMFDSANNEWINLPSMPFPRVGHCAAVVNGKIYVIGGTGSPIPNQSMFLKSLEIFDPLANSWNAGADMPTFRDGLTCCVLNDKIYVVGGENTISGYLDTVEIYNPQTNSWSIGPSMPTGISECASCVIDGKIYVTGGYSESRTLEIFDPSSNTWSYGPDMPSGRCDLACCSVNGKMYAIGGVKGISDIPESEVEVFTPGNSKVNPTILFGSLSINSFPNPFSQSTQISFTSQSAGDADISIVNLLGEQVAHLFSGEMGAGEHSLSWSNPTSLPDGTYECLVRINGQVETLPIVLMR